MIRLLDIKKELTALLKSKFDYKVHFDNVEKSSEPYFYVEMMPRRKTVDEFLTDKSIQIDIMLVLLSDEYGRIKRSILYDTADTLDSLIRPVFHIKDRCITVLESQTRFVDEVLHYVFYLDFADCLTDKESSAIMYDLMQTLELNLK
ncbi:hypothetical protein GXM21_07385 [Megamonas funiformis]|jgi:hypothetical protein|uniref:phage tail terminator family protein n=1 Tax=Megamonas funiformis TaxID=437897 RepID=UPI000586FEFC|nr:hypothetical protein [Megamonas funiformis]QIB60220.1 hypothetical protein GXM21_07385 [Megamonas funiformis]